MRSSDAVVGFQRAVPCVQVRLRGRFARPTHALERQHAQAVLRVDLGTLSPAENVAAVHAQTPESSRRRRSSSRPPSTALGGSAATRAIRAWDRAGQRHRTRPRPSRPAPPNGCSGHPAGSSSGRSTVPPSTARGATWTRTTTTPRGGAAGRARNHAPPAGVHALSLRRRLREAVGAEISINYNKIILIKDRSRSTKTGGRTGPSRPRPAGGPAHPSRDRSKRPALLGRCVVRCALRAATGTVIREK